MSLFDKLKNGMSDEEFDEISPEEFVERVNDEYVNGDDVDRYAIDKTWKELTGEEWKPF